MRLLVTRPESEAERTAATLRAHGHAVLLAPLMRIEAVDAEFGPGPWAAVAISSANALVGLKNYPRFHELIGLPLIAVGDRTAAAARAAGFATVVSAAGASADLAALVREKVEPGQRLLYLAGADRAADPGAALAGAGLTVDTRVVYRAVAIAALPPQVRTALAAGRIDAVLHYSRRSAEAYLAVTAAENLAEAALRPAQLCLSARIAEPLAAAGAADIRIAERPTEAALLQRVDSP